MVLCNNNRLIKLIILFVIPFQFLIAQEIKVNASIESFGAECYYPSIAVSQNGEYIISWIDYRNGENDIYAQRFSNSGIPLGKNFRVTETPGDYYNSGPTIAFLNKQNDFAITWTHKSQAVFTQIYGWAGAKIGEQFIANSSYPYSYSIEDGQITSILDSTFLVTWYEGSLKFRLFDLSGQPITNAISVSDEMNIGSVGRGKIIASNNKDTYAITWSAYDQNNGKTEIYLQLVDNIGNLKGEIVRLSDTTTSVDNIFPTISSISNDKFVVVWDEWYKENSTDSAYVSAQIFNSETGKVGGNIVVNDRNGLKWSNNVGICESTNGTFIISWKERSLLLAKRYSSDGELISDQFEIRPSNENAYPGDVSIESDTNGNYYFTWLDYSNGIPTVYSQIYSNNDIPIGESFRVSDNKLGSWETNPTIAVQDEGDYIIVWEDRRNGMAEIYAQLFDATNSSVMQNIKINTQPYRDGYENPLVKIDPKGDYIITWKGARGSSKIYMQKVSRGGDLIGVNLEMNTFGINFPNNIQINFDTAENILVSWRGTNYHDNSDGIYAQLINPNLNWQSERITYYKYDHASTTRPYIYSYAFDKDLNLCFAGSNYSTVTQKQSNDINIKIISNEQKLIKEEVINNDNDYNRYIQSMVVSNNNDNKFFVSWWMSGASSTSNCILYAKKISNNSEKKLVVDQIVSNRGIRPEVFFIDHDRLGNILFVWEFEKKIYSKMTNIKLNSDSQYKELLYPNLSISQQFDFDYSNGRLYSVWEDNRTNGNGFDIWTSNKTLFEHTYSERQDNYQLYQNYPNPFNNQTNIFYNLEENTSVKIQIFNTLGQKVLEIDRGFQNSGLHYFTLESSRLSNGVYIYHLETGKFKATKKMLLLK